jgi:hypothetical protein
VYLFGYLQEVVVLNARNDLFHQGPLARVVLMAQHFCDPVRVCRQICLRRLNVLPLGVDGRLRLVVEPLVVPLAPDVDVSVVGRRPGVNVIKLFVVDDAAK